MTVFLHEITDVVFMFVHVDDYEDNFFCYGGHHKHNLVILPLIHIVFKCDITIWYLIANY